MVRTYSLNEIHCIRRMYSYISVVLKANICVKVLKNVYGHVVMHLFVKRSGRKLKFNLPSFASVSVGCGNVTYSALVQNCASSSNPEKWRCNAEKWQNRAKLEWYLRNRQLSWDFLPSQLNELLRVYALFDLQARLSQNLEKVLHVYSVVFTFRRIQLSQVYRLDSKRNNDWS